jgi:hypothetical protein
VVLPLYPVILFGESPLLVSWCAGDRCDVVGCNKDHGRSRRPGAEDWRWSSTARILGGRTIERSGDAVCGVQIFWFGLKIKVDSLLVVWPQNHWDRFSGLGLKTNSYDLVI